MLPVETPFKTYTGLDGKPLDGGFVYFGQPGQNPITAPVTVYWDAAGMQPAAQPLRTVNGYIMRAGTPANVFFSGSYSELVQDKQGRQVFYARTSDDFSIATVVQNFLSSLISPTGSSVIGFIQAGMGAIARWVQDKLRESVSVMDFGAKGDGSDDTAAIQKALNTGKRVYFPTPAVKYYITADLSVQPKQQVYGDGDASLIEMMDGSFNGFLLNAADGASVRDLVITVRNQVNATGNKGGVYIVSSNYCKVENVTMLAFGNQGVRLWDSNYCTVRNNRFSGVFGAIQDSADIAVMNNSSYNRIDGNTCNGGGDHGILVQDPYSGSTPTANIITKNIVGAHNANGIIVYVTHAFDTQTIVSNNRVAGIIGSALGGKSGAGIYIQSAGGSIVVGNQVSGCCQQTTDFATQGVGHIAVAIGTRAGYPTGQLAPVIVAKNHINAPRGPGIWCASSDECISVEGNTVLISSIGASDEGRGIYAINCQGVHIQGNTVTQSNPNFQSIQVGSSGGGNVSGTDVSNNWVKTTAYGIAINIVPGSTHADARVKNNRVYNGNNIAMTLEKITNLLCSGNDVESSGIAFTATDIVNSRYGGNRLWSNLGGYGVIFTGNGSGNIVDESNILGATVENDASSGTLISQYGSNVPAVSGLWAVGDRVIAKAPTVGASKGSRCTASGNPGTWTSEGNL